MRMYRTVLAFVPEVNRVQHVRPPERSQTAWIPATGIITTMADICLKSLILLLSIQFGSSSDAIEKTAQHGGRVTFDCGYVDDTDHYLFSKITYHYSENGIFPEDESPCKVEFHQGYNVIDTSCPFDDESAFSASFDELTMTINKFDAAKYTGYWKCLKVNHSLSQVFHLKGYAFNDVTITPKESGKDVHLECNVSSIFPSICKEPNPPCEMNENNTLKWYKGNGQDELTANLESTENPDGLYTGKSTHVVKNITIKEIQVEKKFAYKCVYKNFVGNESTAFYPGQMRNASYSGQMRNESYSGQMRNESHSGQMRNESHSGQMRNESHSGQMRNESHSGQMRNESYSGQMRMDIDIQMFIMLLSLSIFIIEF